MRKAITALFGSSILLTSGAAFAQYAAGGQTGGQYGGTYQPSYQRPSTTDNVGGSDAQIVFGVERVTGVFAHSQKDETDAVTTTDTTTEIALFGNAASNVHALPRLALDYFVIEGFSLGGSLVFYRRSGESETEAAGATVTSDTPTITSFMIQPRVGYSFVLDETFAIWPRGGITYGNTKIEDTVPPIPPATGSSEASTTFSTLALTLDVAVVISPIENFAIMIGPFLDLGVSGTKTAELTPASGASTSIENDNKITTFGVAMGIAGYY
jgi:hypothetical protein